MATSNVEICKIQIVIPIVHATMISCLETYLDIMYLVGLDPLASCYPRQHCWGDTETSTSSCPPRLSGRPATIFHQSLPNFCSIFCIIEKLYYIQFHKKVAKLLPWQQFFFLMFNTFLLMFFSLDESKKVTSCHSFFSSPGLKGHVSFSHHFASVVRPSTITKKSSPLKPLSQFWRNLGGPLPKLCPMTPPLNQDGGQAKNRKKGGWNFKNLLLWKYKANPS